MFDETKKQKVLALGASLMFLLTMFSGVAVADDYRDPTIGVIGNLSSDFGKLFSDDMPDLVIGALILGLIIFLGVVLRKIMTKSTNL